MIIIAVLLSLVVTGLSVYYIQSPLQDRWILRRYSGNNLAGDGYSQIQDLAIMASISREIKKKFKFSKNRYYGPSSYLARTFYRTYDVPFHEPHRKIVDRLSADHNINLLWEDSRLEAYNKSSGANLNIYERKDWKTINALVLESNEWMKAKGRLACEFDGGTDFGIMPYTAFLFNTAYLKYLSLKLGYKDGQYVLVQDDQPAVVLDFDSLLSRNALVRFICYQLLAQTSSLIADKDEATGRKPITDQWGWQLPTYEEFFSFYSLRRQRWRDALEKSHNIVVTPSETGLDFANRKTNEKILFVRDDDLLNEALEKLNYYREKVDFTSHFMVENHPMFLLSVLFLYDVNLQWDEASGKYVIAPGPHDPKRFFEIVSEFTFVNDSSDTKYLKDHLIGWPDFHAEPAEPLTVAWPAAPGWHKTFIKGKGESVQETTDGGYIIAGVTSPNPKRGFGNAFLIKTDSEGEMKWHTTFGEWKLDDGKSVIETTDGGYVIAGSTRSYGKAGSDFWLIKTDSEGTKEWDTTFGGAENEVGKSMAQTADGGYIIVGEKQKELTWQKDQDILLVKTGSKGNEQWRRTYGGKGSQEAYSIDQTTDGGYIIAGSDDRENESWAYLLLVKTDSEGNEQWSKIFAGDGYGIARSVQQTMDGGYIIAGATGSYKNIVGSAWLLKIDTKGNEQWSRTFDNFDLAYGVQQTAEGGYIVVGGYETYDLGENIILIKTGPNGKEQWRQLLGNNKPELGYDVRETSDRGYIITGKTGDEELESVLLIKTFPPK